MEFFLNLLPFLVLPQEMVTDTFVAFYPFPSSPLGLFTTRA